MKKFSDFLNENVSVTTSPDPYGAPGVHHVYVNGTKLNVRILNPNAGVIGGTGRGKQHRSYSIHFMKTDKYTHGFRTIGQAREHIGRMWREKQARGT